MSLIRGLTLFMISMGLLYGILGIPTQVKVVNALLGMTHPVRNDSSPDFPPGVTWAQSFSANPGHFLTHALLMPVALGLGFLQFSSDIRNKYPVLHRWVGRLFLFCLTVGIASIMHMILFIEVYGGALSQWQFIGMSLMTLSCAFIGWWQAWNKNYVSHREWMLRTYFVLWSSAVGSRLGIMLWVPSAWASIGGQNDTYTLPYNACLFVSWSAPLLIADIFIEATKNQEQRSKKPISKLN